jgi:DNA-binding NarL/FixJ family response regulator
MRLTSYIDNNILCFREQYVNNEDFTATSVSLKGRTNPITATATDPDHHVETASTQVTLATDHLRVMIRSPLEGFSTHASAVTVTGMIHDIVAGTGIGGRMRILIVDANPALWGGVISLLRQQADFEVVQEVQNGAEAVKKAQELRPDIILMDIHLPEVDSLEVARRIKRLLSDAKIVLFTNAERDEELLESSIAGAQGYLLKQIRPEALYQALRGVVQGEVAISRAACTRLFEAFVRLHCHSPGKHYLHEVLSPREREVLQALVVGASNKEIASTLGISEHTVKSHLKKISTKLHLRNRVQVVTYALCFDQLCLGQK